MKNPLIYATALLIAASPALADEPAAPQEVTGADELVKQKSSQWAEVWVHPDADIARFDKLYFWQAVFQFRDVSDVDVNRTTTAMLRGDQGPFTISDESRTRFQEIVRDVMVKELGRSKQFEVVDQIGPGTLLVRAMVLDITSNVPPNVGRQGNVHFSAVGEATMVFEIIDAATGVIQARAGDRRLIQPPVRMNQVSSVPTTSATVWIDVELWAADQALTLRQALDRAAKKSKK
jgi:hypothetical protein